MNYTDIATQRTRRNTKPPPVAEHTAMKWTSLLSVLIADMGFEPLYLRYERSEEPLLRNPRYNPVTWVSRLSFPLIKLALVK